MLKIGEACGKYEITNNNEHAVKIINALVRNWLDYGVPYCPCRRRSGNKEQDKHQICPCTSYLDEIQKNGRCHCGLLVGDK